MRFNNNFYCEIRKPKIGRSWQNDLNMKMKIGIERRREGKDDFFAFLKVLPHHHPIIIIIIIIF